VCLVPVITGAFVGDVCHICKYRPGKVSLKGTQCYWQCQHSVSHVWLPVSRP